MRHRRTFTATSMLVFMMCTSGAAWGQSRPSDVINSVHNLSASGTGPVRSSQTQVCIFCHAPHNVLVATKPLWNHQLSTQTYNLYTSSTLSATIEQPSAGVSKVCLSCHDGTVALGQTVANGLISTTGSMPADDVLGTDLRNDHPVTFVPLNDGQLVPSLFQTPPIAGDSSVKLYDGRVECTSCHNPHTENLDVVARKFLVRSNQSGALCLACHDPSRPQPNQLNGWTNGAHRTSTNTAPTTALFGPYGTVAANACVNCHLDHNASSSASPRLLRGYEENACSQCHSGTNLTPTLLNVLGEFSKARSHPTTTLSGSHDANENTFPLNSSRHAECMDCHNSHAASNAGGSTTPPAVQSPLLGASGVDATTGSSPLKPASNQYEICFKCHANSTNKPQNVNYVAYGRTPFRVTYSATADPYNKRLQFNSAVARHNVTNPRQRTSAQVPSVRANMLTFSGASGRSLGSGTYIYCTDCHSSNQAQVSGGTGPNGPHGSTWDHLLERRYAVEIPPATPGNSTSGVTYIAGVSGTYALCYKCHDIDNSILQDRSFTKHVRHIESANASCSTCHDPHGINGGNTTNNFSSVNFDTRIVGPSTGGILRFERTGTFTGRCYLRCHGNNHNPRSY